jgi:PAS domain S-box-containing protein
MSDGLSGKDSRVDPGGGPELQSMLSTAEIESRPSRPPNYETECRILNELSREMARSPGTILQKLAEAALDLCQAHSAGLSLLEDADGRCRFHWRAVAGQWAPHLNGGTPRDFGPCGTVLDRNIPMVCSHPERDFPYWKPIEPVLEEGLLVPFYVKGEAVGTIWVVAHDKSRRFDAEDLRIMTSLGNFTAGAYQTWLSVSAMEHVSSIVETSNDAIISKDLDGIIKSWNRGAERIFGYSAEEIVGRPVTILIPPERQDEEPLILERIRRGEHVPHYDTVRQAKDGRRVDISLTVSPIRNAKGEIVGASKVARDITERKRAEAQIATLAGEAEHRVKNILAMVQATVRMSESVTADGLKRAIEGRIQALANVHSLFVQSHWKGAELGSLAMQELAAYQDGDTRVQIEGPQTLLEPTTAQAIAVVLHELATNAAKYGALSVDHGRIRVEWSRGSEERLVLRWTEAGGPPVKPPSRHGFGSRMIDGVVRRQLHGAVHFDWRPEGFACEIAVQAPSP